MLHAMLRAATRIYYAQEVLADSPVAYWRLGEASGTTAVDEMGSNDGTYNGGTLGVAGLLVDDTDTAVDFDGVDDNVSLPPAAVVSGQQVSVEVWTGTTTTGASATAFRAFTSSARVVNAHLPWSDYTVYWDAGGGTVYDRISKSSTGIDFTAPHHWVFIKDATAGVMEIYLDGSLWHSGSGLTLPVGSPTTFFLGRGENDFHECVIDEFAVYDTALSAARIEAHYNAGTS